MALSASQKMTILRLLCWPAGTIDSTSLDFSNIVTRRLNGISAEAQTQVELLMQWIDETEVQIDKAVGLAGLKRIDEIEFSGTQHEVLRRERSRYLTDLSSMLGIPSLCAARSGGVMGSVSI